MRSREFYWSLFHITEKNQLDNLRTDQVEVVFAALPSQNRTEWLIWRDSFDSWKPFNDFPQLLISLRNINADAAAPAPPPPTAIAEITKGKPPAETTQTRTGKTLTKAKAKEVTRSGFSGTVMKDAKPIDKKRGSPFPENLPHSLDQKFEIDDESAKLTFVRPGLAEDRTNLRVEKEVDIRISAGKNVYEHKTTNISLKGMQLKKDLPKGLPHYFNVDIQFRGQIIPVICSEVRPPDGSPSNRLKIEINDYTAGLLAILLAG